MVQQYSICPVSCRSLARILLMPQPSTIHGQGLKRTRIALCSQGVRDGILSLSVNYSDVSQSWVSFIWKWADSTFPECVMPLLVVACAAVQKDAFGRLHVTCGKHAVWWKRAVWWVGYIGIRIGENRGKTNQNRNTPTLRRGQMFNRLNRKTVNSFSAFAKWKLTS